MFEAPGLHTAGGLSWRNISAPDSGRVVIGKQSYRGRMVRQTSELFLQSVIVTQSNQANPQACKALQLKRNLWKRRGVAAMSKRAEEFRCAATHLWRLAARNRIRRRLCWQGRWCTCGRCRAGRLGGARCSREACARLCCGWSSSWRPTPCSGMFGRHCAGGKGQIVKKRMAINKSYGQLKNKSE